jgi:hypothetical protein
MRCTSVALMVQSLNVRQRKLGTIIIQTVHILQHDTLQRHNTENSKQIFPEKELCGLSPHFHIHVSVSDLKKIFPRSICLFCCRKICGPILGIYNSLTDKLMWKLGLSISRAPLCVVRVVARNNQSAQRFQSLKANELSPQILTQCCQCNNV